MFRKLHLKLTFVNMGIMAVLFLFLTTGCYLFVENRLTTGATLFLKKVSEDLISGRLTDLPPRPGSDGRQELDHKPDFDPGSSPAFFVLIDRTGEVIRTSSNLTQLPEKLDLLAKHALALGPDNGIVRFGNIDYIYVKAAIPDKTGCYLLFLDFSQEKNIMQIVTTALILIGLVCIFLSFFGSLYLANKALIPIKQAWQQQKDFLADASHELRTPLAVIQTSLEIVRSTPDDTVKQHEQWLGNIQTEVSCMAKLVDSLLFLARVDSHQQFFQKSTFNLATAIILAGELFRPSAILKNIELIIKAENIDYCGDEDKLCQVVSILTDNAIRHTKAGGVVTIQLQARHNAAILTVCDTGEGIAAEHLDKIFNRFYQADPSRSDGGSGLGLSIAKLIIESHAGTIAVSSRPGKGTSFIMTLPIRQNMPKSLKQSRTQQSLDYL
ncbi:MAG: sensor histidine kinase [Sporomusa sp.]